MSRADRPYNTLRSWLHADLAGGDRALGDVHVDSRNIAPGDVFIALSGERADGRDFAPAAEAKGAAAILVESGCLTPALTQLSIPVVEVPDLARRAAQLAADFYRLQACRTSAIGVTGTNGKTTVTALLAQLLCALGQPCALVGTLGWGFAGQLQDTGMTTPDAVSMARILKALEREGARHVAIEVSSHGLSQGRVDQLTFAAAVFTNLSQDHLDYHENMAAYAAAKRQLFLVCKGLQVINIDDDYGREMFADHHIVGEPKLAYSLSDPRAHVYCRRVDYSVAGSSAELVTPWGEATLSCPLPGDFNLLNLLACITLLGAWGFPPDRVAPLLPAVRGAPGRMEVVHSGGSMVIVDYAHTPDALDKVLGSLRRHVRRQLSVVIGCGGNRDRGKRPLMAASATTLADVAIFTSDNPREEKPEAILQDMTRELDDERRARVTIEVDRRAAIALALSRAQEGDVVVIAGKGHEDYQEVCGRRLPFSDSACVREFYQEAG